MIRFDCAPRDFQTAELIARRAVELGKTHGVTIDYMQTHMDLIAVHVNDRPLKLFQMLCCDNGDFSHDVLGIAKFIDRATGKLRGGFIPRFSEAAR